MVVATPLILSALALLLAGPVPTLLARAGWPAAMPRAALVLWQALALAATLAALGAGVSLGLVPVTGTVVAPAAVVAHVAVLALTVVVAVRLGWTAARLAVRVRRRRDRHRTAVDLLGREDTRAPGARIVDVGRPLAYCVPGVPARVVVSEAALARLDDTELAAVLEHEQAHVRARHDLVLEGFRALHEAFPRWVRSREALTAASTLIEMLADDAARARTGARPLARALVTLAESSNEGSPATDACLGTVPTPAVARVRRLSSPADPRHQVWSVLVYAGAVTVVVVPTVAVAVPWLQTLIAALR